MGNLWLNYVSRDNIKNPINFQVNEDKKSTKIIIYVYLFASLYLLFLSYVHICVCMFMYICMYIVDDGIKYNSYNQALEKSNHPIIYLFAPWIYLYYNSLK